MISIRIDVTKIPKEKLYKGKKGTYLDVVLIERPDDYQNDGFVAISRSKEEREAREPSVIIGNWKTLGNGTKKSKPQQKPKASEPEPEPEDDLPWD